MTRVYQFDSCNKRLLWLGVVRKEAALQAFFDWYATERAQALYYVCCDMWKPYLNVIARNTAQTINILNRFHIMATISKVRAEEARQMKSDTYSRY